ncbi:MAG: L-fucose:H+ symporter permease [Spirochaetae bacterium HGW-Spirochaetae-1]|nr:MAG: L-fucose:H+ symporter permease [Spirochaetae bacterium HGW-Spirochaetae-1]
MISTGETRSAAAGEKKYTRELSILTSLFFMWGFLTCLNDILIPHLKSVFALNYARAMLVQFCFFGAYFLMSLPSGYILKKVGYKNGIVMGLLIAGTGCFLFYPSAAYRSYYMFLSAFFVLASGITLLQVSANPYVTVLGREETASSRLNLTQAFNSLGTTIAPYFGSMLILAVAVKTTGETAVMSGTEREAHHAVQAAAVQVPYLGLGAALFIIAAVFAFIKLPDIGKTEDGEKTTGDSRKGDREGKTSAWEYRHLVLGALGIFLYVGAEVSIGSFLVNFFGQSNMGGLSEISAGKLVSWYWGGAMVGRFIGSALMRKINPRRILAFNASAAAFLVLAAVLTRGNVSMVAILLVGLCNSIMFPTIFSLSIRGLGPHTGEGSGILCMAIVGGAIVPFLQGLIADRAGIQPSFMLPAVCYLYIVFFSVKGADVCEKEKGALQYEV